jgi:broad specificity phosphatase PhoE
VPAHEWGLDPSGFAAIDELRHSGRLPKHAHWFSSPERKAVDTARRLTDALLSGGNLTVVPELAEHRRDVHWFADANDFGEAVRRAFRHPDARAVPAWEPLAATRKRLLPAVRRILVEHVGDALVLCGHGTAWTLLVAELTCAEPDLGAWERLKMPDLWVLDLPPAG